MSDYLKIITEQEYLNETFEYPTICYVKENNMLRFPAHAGYQNLDMADGMWQAADGDILIKE
jgi:hypothetical protein